MIVLQIEPQELYDDSNDMFYVKPGRTVRLEHSLRSLTEWEHTYKKPFLSSQKSLDEMLDYFDMMCLDGETISSDLNLDGVQYLTDYISEKHTATTLRPSSEGNKGKLGVMTSEVIYAYMADARIPFSCDTWNLDRLLTILGVISELHAPGKKMSEADIMRQQAQLNAQRKAKMAKPKGV